jgi:hypothetical protein
MPIWVYFAGPWNGIWWYILLPCGIFYGHLYVLHIAIWYILWLFGAYIVSRFGMFLPRKVWQPWIVSQKKTILVRPSCKWLDQLLQFPTLTYIGPPMQNPPSAVASQESTFLRFVPSRNRRLPTCVRSLAVLPPHFPPNVLFSRRQDKKSSSAAAKAVAMPMHRNLRTRRRMNVWSKVDDFPCKARQAQSRGSPTWWTRPLTA